MYKRFIQVVGYAGVSFLLTSGIVFAAPRTFKLLVSQIISLFNTATIILFSIAILAFFISVVRNMYGSGADNADQKKKLRQTLTYGIIILFVMVSVWGIIAILQNALRGNF